MTLCRLCMTEDSASSSRLDYSLTEANMVSIFSVTEEGNINISVIKLLKETNPRLSISQQDSLPKFACSICIKNLVKFYSFQQQCLKSEEELKKLYHREKQNDLVVNEKCSTEEIEDNGNICIKIVDDVVGLEQQYSNDNNDIEYISSDIKDEDIQSVSSDFSIELVWSDEEDNVKKLKDFNEHDNPKVEHMKASSSSSHFESYQCDICDRVLKTKKTLTKHRMLHGKEKVNKKKRVTCNICNKEYLMYGLKEHMLTHTGLKPYLCSECGKSFTSSGSLRQHILRHKNDRRYQCPDCPRNFPCRSDLLSHSHVHKAAPKSHVCDVCGSGFSKAYILKKHKMYHNNERLFRCEFCDKRFYTAEKCRRHVRIHTGEKPYRCKFCEKAYCQSNELTKHLRCHLGENIYQCELCPQRFPNVKKLREHFAGHKDDDEETRERNLLALKQLEPKGLFFK